MNVTEKIERATQLKDQGNESFKQDDRKVALRHYHEAVMFLHGLNGPRDVFIPPNRSGETVTEAQATDIDGLLASIYSNISACHLKDSNWDQVIKYSSKSLEKDATNFKARIRRVNAQLSIGGLEKAAEDLVILLDKQPKDPDVQRLRLKLRQLESEADARQRSEFAGMFDRDNK
ncbi:hypothetical protein BDF19DRAFT_15133 [Syncephalis fuscata]|nr:hypothetical protein BDF19DRAFT_15133 [Syncephalis fuscata]